MTGWVCGTGGWTGPLPGDPDNNSILTATPAFGGIEVSWTFPLLNPYAVAHTELYRSTINDFSLAVRRAVVDGSYFFDRLDAALGVPYYYWIVIVSVNGTYGDPIGPATASPRPLIEDLIEQLTGQIDAGVLAQSLKTEIDKITLNGNDLFTEIQNRIAADDLMGATVQQAQDDVNAALTYINTEITQRIAADNAFVQQLNVMAASVNDNTAAILNEQTLRVSADSTLAAQITTVQSGFESDLASVQTTLQTNIDTVNDEVTSIGALYTAKVTVNGLVGGFGVYNDGTEVEAGFDVDTFWIGRTAANKRKPFIVQNDEVFIDQAVINQLTFSKLRAADGSLIVADGKIQAAYLAAEVLEVTNAQINGDIWSTDYVAGTSGWLIDRDGSAEFRNVLARGDIEASTLKANTAMVQTAHLVNASVDTLAIAGNAVTVPVHAYTAGSVAIAGFNTIQSAYIATGGQPITILFFAKLLSGSTNDDTVTVRILDPNGVELVSDTLDLGALKSEFVTMSYQHNVDGTYVVQAASNETASFAKRSLVLLGTKR